jgi:phage terminase large subunit-like protein
MTSLAERLAALPRDERAAAVAALRPDEAQALLHDWRSFLARPEQIAPEGDWQTWLVLAGRGFGKTRLGAEWIREEVEAGRATRIALIGETAKDTRDVMVEGPSGILGVYPEGERPVYEPSKARVTFRNGAVATLYNATEPDQLRGPQFDCAWCDELAKWRYARETWDMLQFGLRLGSRPRQIVTTTPRPIPLIRELIANARTTTTRGSTFDNAANLAPAFIDSIREKYEGTRLGRQELNAEILDDIPGALWTRDMIEKTRRNDLPPLRRVVVAVDPAVSSGEDADEHGIIVAGSDDDSRGWIVEDGSLRGSPLDWARRALALHDRHEADGIVVEINQGGEMVAQTLRSVRPNVRIIEVRATRGKHVRAEPIAALYEQGRVSHLGAFPELEDQLVLMTSDGYAGERSPDRADALVWALTELFPSIIRPVARVDHAKLLLGGRRAGWMR